ncbi:MAG: PilZ domain-containing protein [Pyrinomonadaceae bacterium]
MTDKDTKTRRLRDRIALSLPVRVSCRESIDYEWVEMSHLVDVTPFGARLRLKRPTEVGRLLWLTLAMPRQLRCFDYIEDQYRVWALVRNLKTLEPQKENRAVVEIGVAFVGKHPPRSFAGDPSRRYEILSSQSGLWAVREDSSDLLTQVDTTDRRELSRQPIPVEVTIEVFSDNGTFSAVENTVTENLSSQGAAVFTTLDLKPGRFVRMSSPHSGANIIAAVRERRVGADGITRLHLQFIGSEWQL